MDNRLPGLGVPLALVIQNQFIDPLFRIDPIRVWDFLFNLARVGFSNGSGILHWGVALTNLLNNLVGFKNPDGAAPGHYSHSGPDIFFESLGGHGCILSRGNKWFSLNHTPWRKVHSRSAFPCSPNHGWMSSYLLD